MDGDAVAGGLAGLGDLWRGVGNTDGWSAAEKIIFARRLEKDGGWLNTIHSIYRV